MQRRKSTSFWPLCLTLTVLLAATDAGRSTAVAQPDEAHEVESEGGVESEVDILEPQPALAIYTVIVFLLLLAILWRYAWGPLSKALHDREHSLETTFNDAEKARAEAAALLEQHRKQMDAAQEQVRQIMDDANRRAQTVYDERLQKAQVDAEATADRAAREIATAKEQALLEIWGKTANLAVDIAQQVLTKDISEDDHRRLVQLATEELPSNGAGGGQGALA